MNFLLDKKRFHEEACAVAIRDGGQDVALFHAAKAAEFDYALAEQMPGGKLAEKYIEDAQGWLEVAEKLKKTPLSGRNTSESGNPVLHKTEKIGCGVEKSEEWLVVEKPDIRFEAIIGVQDAKQSIQDMILYPISHPEKAQALGLRAGGGILLYGPPGNGKTMIGKAIAAELDAPFYYASGAQLRSKWHGESEQRLRQLMQKARSHPLAVLFFDEMEGLLPRRGGNSVVDNRIVTQFLAEIGGFEESGNALLLLGATNCPWDMDDAAFRTGRFDVKIYIGLPDASARMKILQLNLQNVSLAADVDLESLNEQLQFFAGSDLAGLVNVAKRLALRSSIQEQTLPMVSQKDLLMAREMITPSASPGMLSRFEAFRKR